MSASDLSFRRYLIELWQDSPVMATIALLYSAGIVLLAIYCLSIGEP